MKKWALPIALGVVAAIVVLAAAALLVPKADLPQALPLAPQEPEPITIIAVARNSKGTEVPVAIAEMAVGTHRGELMPPVDMPMAIEGDRGRSVVDAYVFGGGNGVAEYLKNGDRKPQWVVLRPASWSRLLASQDATVDVAVPVDAYIGGSLLEIDPGIRTLSATELAGVAGAADAFPNASARRRVQRSLGSAFAASLATTRGAAAVDAALESGTPTSLSQSQRDAAFPKAP